MRRILSALIILTLGSFVVLTSSSASADTSATATATVTVGSACTLNSVLDTPHTATIPSGTNQSEIGKTTFTVVCNNTGGYSIYAVGYSNFEFGNTKLLATINGALNSNYDINTGTNASGTPSSWAMKLTPSTNLTASNILNGFGSYSAVPSSYVKVATLVPTTTMVNTSSLEATYRVNIASTQPAGNYNGKVRYVMVDPNTNVPNEPKACSSNKICYWPNAGNTVNDTMGDQTVYPSYTSAILWASNFKRTGYGFAGWSDAYDYVANVGSESNPDAHIYGPNETINDAELIASIKSNGLSLYAVWVKPEGYLQNWNDCSSLGQGKVTALTDRRDSDVYAVAKLADGNCWMIENLRLDADDSKDSSLAQGFGGVFVGLANAETDNFTATISGDTSPTVANSLYYAGAGNQGNLGATIDITQTNKAGFRMPRYRDDNTNPNTTVANMTGVNQNVYSYGNYYSWPAAKANTSFLANETNSNTANTSLCPAGWRLPTGYGSGDFGLLSNSLGGYKNSNNEAQSMDSSTIPTGAEMSIIIRSYPNNYVYSGGAGGENFASSLGGRGGEGNYWSATAAFSESASNLNLYNGAFNPVSGSYKFQGYSIRCVIDN